MPRNAIVVIALRMVAAPFANLPISVFRLLECSIEEVSSGKRRGRSQEAHDQAVSAACRLC
jgi:hypothetical protein